MDVTVVVVPGAAGLVRRRDSPVVLCRERSDDSGLSGGWLLLLLPYVYGRRLSVGRAWESFMVVRLCDDEEFVVATPMTIWSFRRRFCFCCYQWNGVESLFLFSIFASTMKKTKQEKLNVIDHKSFIDFLSFSFESRVIVYGGRWFCFHHPAVFEWGSLYWQ